ncbi:hypothetical protein [Lentzea flaviverrucosa]|uniref:Uncharacterized protein n=1 Tax=Lentzea flaviverrucosa TaxID=200379 RepID=A0A1H9A2J7_9PSEU|nr:hypothetical protein [Lentzea flaviverrucosa]RDI32182.1 hypothetical protein DFR72_103583 [Lentzea flaviverrucosa]SEP70900.1 hypothetical protein SAMN05216195_10175 [Lentzea flaviverrucosa]
MATTPSASRGEPPRPPEERKPVPESGSTVTEHLENGAVVTYFDPSPSAEAPFRRAVAIGPEIVDPCTNLRWIPLIGNDWSLDMVMWPLVVDIAPS